MAMIPLVSGKLSIAYSTCPSIMDSAKVVNTFPSCFTALAIRFKLRCCFLSLAIYNILRKRMIKNIKIWKLDMNEVFKNSISKDG